MKIVVKYVLFALFKLLLFVMQIFPIKRNRILFISYSGKSISGNPLYIYKGLLKHNNNFDYIWGARNHKMNSSVINKNTKIIPFFSMKMIYYFATSRIIISNDYLYDFFIKRNHQIMIQTWHGGGAYKKIGDSKKKSYIMHNKNIEKSFDMYDYFISSCKMFTNCIIQDGLNYNGNILKIGLPRNDLFFLKESNFNGLRLEFNLHEDWLVVLYAPTFRSNNMVNVYDIDFRKIKTILEKKYSKKVVFLVRLHHKVKEKISYIQNLPYIIDVSYYPDVQKIIVVSDILITDYSSIMWDFSITHKPCFLYASDLDTYTKNPGFYIKNNDLPGIIVNNNNELLLAMEFFDGSKYAEKIKNHHNYMGSYEQGIATDYLIDLIINNTKG